MKKHFLFLIFLTLSYNSYSQEIINEEKAYILSEVDEKPIYKDGIQKFYNRIVKKIKVPELTEVNGEIIVEFIIEKDGSITNFTVIQDIGYGTAEEVRQAFKNCPNWQPGKKGGDIIRTLYRLPITITGS